MREVDIVIISYAKDEILLKETRTCIDSLYQSENSKEIKFNVFVVESNHDINYNDYNLKVDFPRNVITIHPTVPFGYHRYLNIGRKAGNAEYVVLCNNDLTFKQNWASNAIDLMEQRKVWSAGCCNPNKKIHQKYINEGRKCVDGWVVSNHITGWVIFQKREIYEHIGDLDEEFEFWYCDNDYSATLKELGFYHTLIIDSVVYHHNGTLGSTTKREKDEERKKEITEGGRVIFNKKWDINGNRRK